MFIEKNCETIKFLNQGKLSYNIVLLETTIKTSIFILYEKFLSDK